MPGVESTHYNDSNRVFLQVFLSRNTLTLETAKPILAAIFSVHEGRECLPNDITEDDLHSYISAANTAVSPLDLEIRSVFHQETRERCYALVNTTSDPLTQLATTYSVDEIAFLKRALDRMFDGENNRPRKEAMCLSGIEAVQLAKSGARRETQNGATQGSASQGLSMRDAENMLSRLVEEGWFEKSQKGFYSLSPRALMELRGWLVETYNEPPDEGEEEEPPRDKIKFCHACKEIITVGQRCTQRECPCRLHDICTQNFFRMQRSQTCPLCKTDWDGKHYVGEKAITTSESYLQGRRRSGVGRPAPAASDEAEEEDNDDG